MALTKTRRVSGLMASFGIRSLIRFCVSSSTQPLMRALASNWRLSGILTARSGSRLNITSGVDRALIGSHSSVQRPDLLSDDIYGPGKDVSDLEPGQQIDNYFNRDNVVLPPATAPFGNAGRNSVRGYAFYQLDFGLHKKFALPIRQGASVEIRAEAFNVLNKTNFGLPNGDRNSGAFGTIRSTFPARQLQLAAKLSF